MFTLSQSGLPTRQLWAERSKCSQIHICSSLQQLKCQEVVLLGLPWSINLAVHCKLFSPAEFTLALNSIMMAVFSFVPIQSSSQQKWQQPKHHYSTWVPLEKSAGHSLFLIMGLKRDWGDTTKCLQVGNISYRPSFLGARQLALGLLLGWWGPEYLASSEDTRHWKTQMLCIWTVPFLLTLLKRPANKSSKPP